MAEADTSGRGAGPAWALFAGFSLAAVLAGAWTASAHGVAPRAWLLDLAAWAVGGLCAAGLARARSSLAMAWPALALLGLLATFIDAGLSGVHRWAAIGPLRLNAAELLLPAAMVGFAALSPSGGLRLLFALAALSLLVLQPDASQAVALAGGMLAATLLWRGRRLQDGLTAFACLAIPGLALLRPDPLAPVAEVEGVVGLAWGVSPALAGLAVLALAGAVLSPLLLLRGAAAKPPPVRAAALGLCVLLTLAALAPLVGAFPVPLVGMGVSPILGAWLGFGALMSLRGRAATA